MKHALALILMGTLVVVGCGDDDDDHTDQDSGVEEDSGTTQDSGGDQDAGEDAGVTAVTPEAAGDIVITELHAAPVFPEDSEQYSLDAYGEFVEIYNPSTTVTYNLNGCLFGDNADTIEGAPEMINTDVIIGPGEYAVLSSHDDADVAGFEFDYTYWVTSDDDTIGLSGGGDQPQIVCNDVVIDVVDYENPAKGDATFPDVGSIEGRSLSLDPGSRNATDNDDGCNWCLTAEEDDYEYTDHADLGEATPNYGTPGEANPECPPSEEAGCVITK